MKKGWQTKHLGDLCDVVGGGTPPKDKPAFYSGDIPWATVRDMRQDVITETEFRITKDAVKSSATNIIPAGNVVIATRVGLGKVCLIGQDTAINQDLRGIVPRSDKALVVRFLYWWLKSIADVIVAEGTGATVQGVKLPFVKSLQIPVPPLAEQQRIVGLLDEAFEGLATAKANAEKNLQNARALFESHLHSVFTQRGPGWVEKTIGEVCDFRGGGTPSKAVEHYWKGKIPWVSPKDMKSEIVSDTIDHISQEAIDGSATSLIPHGAVLMVVRSGILARIVPLAVTGRELTINQDLKALCPKNVIESRFLYSLLESKMPELTSLVSRGATVHRLQTEQIRSLAISIPPKAAQQQIIKRIDSMREETQRLARLYERKHALLTALKKSLLHQAFTGEL